MNQKKTSPRFTTLRPAREGDRPFTAEDLWSIPRVGAGAVIPGSAGAIAPVTTYDLETNEKTTRLYRVGLAGETPRALTPEGVVSTSPAVSPDGTRLAFVRKAKGERHGQLHVMPLDGGESERITDLPLGVNDPRWLPDGSGVAFVSELFRDHMTVEDTRAEVKRRAEDPVVAHVTEDRVYRYWDRWLTTGETPHVMVVDLASREVRDLTPDAVHWMGLMELTGHFDVSPEGDEIAFAAIFTEGPLELLRSAVFTVPMEGGAPRALTREVAPRAQRPRYTPDGSGIVYGVSLDPEFYADRVRLMRFDRAAGAHGDVLTEWDLSPSGWDFGPDGRLFFVAETNGRTCLYTLDDTDVPNRLTQDGTVGSPRALADGGVVVTYESLSSPPELWLASASGDAPRRLTHFTDGALAGIALGEVRDVHFKGAENEAVQMFVVLPPGHDPGNPAPLVHVIHGGPHGISGDSFHFRWSPQLFAAPGYVAAMVNFQGSTSWGQDFAQRIQGAWGDRPYRDVMAATDVLIESGLADPSRMAAAGGSYGGYMTSWIASRTDRFRCVVNHAGVYDLLAQYASDVTEGRSKSFGGNAWDGLEAVQRWSPATIAGDLATPMLVIHGEKDYRVPVTQGLACYNVLKAKGVPARLVYFPDENHWVLKPRNGLVWYREVHDWLARFLTVPA